MKNLLDKKWFYNSIKQGIFPGIFQIITLIILILILFISWNYHNIQGISAADPLVYTNLGNLLFWIYWMMGIIILVLIWGRTWCAICPLGMINGIFSKFGLKLNYPKSLRNWYLLVIIFIALQIAITTLQINHFPDLTARLIFVFILAVIIFGLLFQDRIFCRYLCPVGSMIGIYACLSPLELRVKDKKICSDCVNKECIRGKTDSYNLFFGTKKFPFKINSEPCPAQIFPASLNESTNCFLCGQCIKNCPNDNIRWNTRPPFKEICEPNQRPFYETLFVILLLGMILEKFIPLWPELYETLSLDGKNILLHYLWIYLILPGIIILLPAGLIYLTSQIQIIKLKTNDKIRTTNDEQLSTIITYSTNIFIPLIFFAHLSLAIVKIATRGGFLFYGLIDPVGIKSYRAIYLAEIFNPPSNIMPIWFLKWIVWCLISTGAIISSISLFKTNKVTELKKNFSFSIINFLMILFLGSVFMIIVKVWLAVK